MVGTARSAARAMLGAATRMQPREERDRAAEEWAAELETFETSATALGFAWGVLRTAPRTAMARRHGDPHAFLEISLGSFVAALGPAVFCGLALTNDRPGTAFGHLLLSAGLLGTFWTVWHEKARLFSSTVSRLAIATASIGAAIVALAPTQAPSPGPYETQSQIGLLAVAIGLALFGLSRLFPRTRSLPVVRSAMVLVAGGLATVAIFDTSNAWSLRDHGGGYIVALLLTAFGAAYGSLMCVAVYRREEVFFTDGEVRN